MVKILRKGQRLKVTFPTGTNYKKLPIALTGRVPVNVTTHGGADPIEPGDWLTASEIPGVAMKATTSGVMIGRALSSFDGAQDDNGVMVSSSNHDGEILVFVDVGWAVPENKLQTTIMIQ